MTTPVATPHPVARFLRSLHVSPRYKVAYVNNAKVACSSIKLALQRAELDDPSYEPQTSVHDSDASPLLTGRKLTAETWRGALDGCYVFTFVRSPWARLRSAWLNKIVTGQKGGKFREKVGFAADEVPSFEAFVHALGGQEPSKMDAHWRPQWINISHDVIEFDFIGRLETVKDDWAGVAARTGLPPNLPRAGKRTVHDSRDTTYSAAMVAVVRDIYAEDLSRFDYPDSPN